MRRVVKRAEYPGGGDRRVGGPRAKRRAKYRRGDVFVLDRRIMGIPPGEYRVEKVHPNGYQYTSIVNTDTSRSYAANAEVLDKIVKPGKAGGKMSGVIERMLKSGEITLDDLKAGHDGGLKADLGRSDIERIAKQVMARKGWRLDTVTAGTGGRWNAYSRKHRLGPGATMILKLGIRGKDGKISHMVTEGSHPRKRIAPIMWTHVPSVQEAKRSLLEP